MMRTEFIFYIFFVRFRNENIKLVSQAEYNDERIKTLQSNVDVLQRQVASLEKNNSTLQG